MRKPEEPDQQQGREGDEDRADQQVLRFVRDPHRMRVLARGVAQHLQSRKAFDQVNEREREREHDQQAVERKERADALEQVARRVRMLGRIQQPRDVDGRGVAAQLPAERKRRRAEEDRIDRHEERQVGDQRDTCQVEHLQLIPARAHRGAGTVVPGQEAHRGRSCRRATARAKTTPATPTRTTSPPRRWRAFVFATSRRPGVRVLSSGLPGDAHFYGAPRS